MNRKIESGLIVFARFLLSLIFIVSGLGKIGDWSGTAASMAAKGMVVVPIFLVGAILCELTGGLLILAGKVRWGAWVLVLYLIPVTLTYHNFWAYAGAEQKAQLTDFLKNLSIMGGLLLVAFRRSHAHSAVAHEKGQRRKTPKIAALVNALQSLKEQRPVEHRRRHTHRPQPGVQPQLEKSL